MATPMITRPVVIPRAMQSRPYLLGLLCSAASGQLTATPPTSDMNSRCFTRKSIGFAWRENPEV